MIIKSINLHTVIILSVLLIGCGETVEKLEHTDNVDETSTENIHKVFERENVSSLSHEYAKHRKQQIKSVDYDLSFEFDVEKKFFTGETTIHFVMAEANKSAVTIDFNEGTVESIQVNEQQVNWNYNQWFIRLASDLFNPGANEIKIKYTRP